MSVLTYRERRDAGVETSFTFCIDVMHNVRLDRHSAMVVARASRAAPKCDDSAPKNAHVGGPPAVDAAVRTRQTNARDRAGRRVRCDGH